MERRHGTSICDSPQHRPDKCDWPGLDIALATLDKELAAAASSIGVHLLGITAR
jgi:hypothetical protein